MGIIKTIRAMKSLHKFYRTFVIEKNGRFLVIPREQVDGFLQRGWKRSVLGHWEAIRLNKIDNGDITVINVGSLKKVTDKVEFKEVKTPLAKPPTRKPDVELGVPQRLKHQNHEETTGKT